MIERTTRRALLLGGAGLVLAREAGAAGDAGAPPPTAKLDGAQLDALLAEIARARRGLRTLRARFTQDRKIRLLATTVRSTGELFYVAPDRLRWELAPPDDVIYWIGPEGLSYRTRSSKGTMPAGAANVARTLGDVRALLTGDLGSLRQRYELSGARGEGDVTLEGTARDPAASVRAFSLALDKRLVVPLRARLVEGKNDTIDLAFSDAKADAPIDPALMRP